MINTTYKSLYRVCLWKIKLTNHSTEYVYDKYNLQITLESMINKIYDKYNLQITLEYVYDKYNLQITLEYVYDK